MQGARPTSIFFTCTDQASCANKMDGFEAKVVNVLDFAYFGRHSTLGAQTVCRLVAGPPRYFYLHRSSPLCKNTMDGSQAKVENVLVFAYVWRKNHRRARFARAPFSLKMIFFRRRPEITAGTVSRWRFDAGSQRNGPPATHPPATPGMIFSEVPADLHGGPARCWFFLLERENHQRGAGWTLVDKLLQTGTFPAPAARR